MDLLSRKWTPDVTKFQVTKHDSLNITKNNEKRNHVDFSCPRKLHKMHLEKKNFPELAYSM